MSRFSNFIDAVETELGDSTVKFVDSHPDRKGQHGPRRRIHWYLTGGTLEKAQRAGGTETGGGTAREPAVFMRYEKIAVTLFAEDVDSLDTLFDNLIVAIDHVAPNGGVLFSDSYDFIFDQYSKRIPIIEWSLDVKLPVVDEIKPLKVLTDEQHTCEYEA
jgi:hypothetical protein